MCAYTVVRGGAVPGARLCGECSKKYYQYDTDNRPTCHVCGRKIIESIGVFMCMPCSAELEQCQGRMEPREDPKTKKSTTWVCEQKLSTNIEELKKSRRAPKKRSVTIVTEPSKDASAAVD